MSKNKGELCTIELQQLTLLNTDAVDNRILSIIIQLPCYLSLTIMLCFLFFIVIGNLQKKTKLQPRCKECRNLRVLTLNKKKIEWEISYENKKRY